MVLIFGLLYIYIYIYIGGVFMTNDQSTVEKDDVLPPKPLPPPLSIFPLQPFVPDSQTRLTHSSSTYSRHLFTTDNISHSRWHDVFCNIYIYI